MYMHTHTPYMNTHHTCMYICTHVYVHERTCTVLFFIYIYHWSSLIRELSYMYKLVDRHAEFNLCFLRTAACFHTQAQTSTHKHKHTHACTHTQIHASPTTHLNKNTHTCYCTCTHAYKHTQTHKYTLSPTHLNKNIHTESKTVRDALRQVLRTGDCATVEPDRLDWRRVAAPGGVGGSLLPSLRASKFSVTLVLF